MNCFHFHIFDISETASIFLIFWKIELWIAFIFISLTYQKQQNSVNTYADNRCELLSFSYLWHIRNSESSYRTMGKCVVNCFHFHIFDISETAIAQGISSAMSLWIAFIFISLTYQKQLLLLCKSAPGGCELLSFSYLWHIRNSF